MSESIYAICDKNGYVLHMEGVEILGRKVTIPAVFLNKDDALALVVAAEIKNPHLIPQFVRTLPSEIELGIVAGGAKFKDAFVVEGPLCAFFPGFEAPTYGEDGKVSGAVRVAKVDKETNTIWL
jgi:hypothetical protein